jgi:hypothetical protein
MTTQRPYSRSYGKIEFMLQVASFAGRNDTKGKVVIIAANEKSKENFIKRIFQINNGAWPYRLRIILLEEIL